MHRFPANVLTQNYTVYPKKFPVSKKDLPNREGNSNKILLLRQEQYGFRSLISQVRWDIKLTIMSIN